MQDTISVKGLHSALNDKGYICNSSFVSRIATSIHAKPVGGAFLYGPAGTGKSLLPQVLAEILERKLFFHQCSAGTREDDLLMRIWPNEDTKSGVKIEYGKVYEASKASQSEEVIVVLDEWDKTKPSADGFFLDFLQYGPPRFVESFLERLNAVNLDPRFASLLHHLLASLMVFDKYDPRGSSF